MAKMIPSFIERNDPRRTGEYMVYDWLSKEDIPGVVFYSHPQNNHEKKTMSEVDFLYICANGILCIEVKGGVIQKKETKWKSINKKGQEFDIQDPFWQSHGCMKAIASTLEGTYGKKSIESRFCVGCAVVFPECIAECEGDSVIKDVMFDGRNEVSLFGDFLLKSLRYWSDDLYKKQSKRTISMNAEQIEQIVTLFEADFCAVQSMKLQIDTSYNEMLRLTEEQYDVLSSIDDNARAFVYGAAGTGKSLLAVEKLKTTMCKNRQVAYICFNNNMASYVKENVKVVEGSYIGTYHALLGEYIANSHELELEELNEVFIEQKVVPKRIFDLIIVDEAQDILSESTMRCLDSFVKQGLNSGEWIFFADPNQDIFLKGNYFSDTVKAIKEKYNPCMLRLLKNCRNTAQIARRNSMLTSIPPSKYMQLTGPEVRAIEFDTKADFVEKLDKEIRSLMAGGTYIKDIIILSPKKFENSMLSETRTLADTELVEVRSFKGLKKTQLNYMTVQSFKGLERKIVFYVDIDGFESMNNRRINYVAMSRAQIMLYYFYPKSMKGEYESRILEGMEVLSQ
ncbi:nuclease-related domain-containing DEAD/DEAH box helicase [Kineothrix sedimenti]|uniref:NERD domain-containing protein n=1 Tax=Kineothrix sedimenti TaxID=3123317 RepID=A0ABZ3EX09_9FIRM